MLAVSLHVNNNITIVNSETTLSFASFDDLSPKKNRNLIISHYKILSAPCSILVHTENKSKLQKLVMEI